MSIKTSGFIIQSQIRTFPYALKRQLKRIYKKILLPIVDFIFSNYA
jgi:hypothetical protein